MLYIPMLLGGCLDLGISRPHRYAEAAGKLANLGLDFVVLMEDRQPDFFLSYDGFREEAYVRLNRHGPFDSSSYQPTQQNLREFVKTLSGSGIDVMYGFWVHENRWVVTRHPELLLTDVSGRLWHSKDFSSDFNPLLEFAQDDEYYGISRGERFVEFACRQYRRLSDDFGFNGLFVGDGGMGFRMFGDDSIGANFFDYSRVSLNRFIQSEHCLAGTHQGSCPLATSRSDNLQNAEEGLVRQIAEHVSKFHLEEFTEWNCAEWVAFYWRLSTELRQEGRKELLGSYTCMNYGPALAKPHGVDYSSIAKVGLDYLVFQSYSYAWGEHFGLAGKDTGTNQEQLEYLQSELRSLRPTAKTKILFSAETGDSVEKWSAPAERTLEEARTYAGVGKFGGKLADGAFIVWLNEAEGQVIEQIRGALG